MVDTELLKKKKISTQFIKGELYRIKGLCEYEGKESYELERESNRRRESSYILAEEIIRLRQNRKDYTEVF